MDPKRRFAIISKAKQQRNIEHIYTRSIKGTFNYIFFYKLFLTYLENPKVITEPRLSLGFEAHTEPKLVGLLSDPSEEKRLNAMSLIYTHIANHEKIIRVLQCGLDS